MKYLHKSLEHPPAVLGPQLPTGRRTRERKRRTNHADPPLLRTSLTLGDPPLVQKKRTRKTSVYAAVVYEAPCSTSYSESGLKKASAWLPAQPPEDREPIERERPTTRAFKGNEGYRSRGSKRDSLERNDGNLKLTGQYTGAAETGTKKEQT